jgi:hypothetical protein
MAPDQAPWQEFIPKGYGIVLIKTSSHQPVSPERRWFDLDSTIDLDRDVGAIENNAFESISTRRRGTLRIEKEHQTRSASALGAV